MRKTARQNTKIGATKKRAVRFRKPGQPKQLALNRLPQIASDRLPQTACFSGDGWSAIDNPLVAFKCKHRA